MILVVAIIALVFLPVVFGVGGSLARIASAIEAQNRHYGITKGPKS